MMAKFIQIAVAMMDVPESSGRVTILALDNEGIIWELDRRPCLPSPVWEELPWHPNQDES